MRSETECIVCTVHPPGQKTLLFWSGDPYIDPYNNQRSLFSNNNNDNDNDNDNNNDHSNDNDNDNDNDNNNNNNNNHLYDSAAPSRITYTSENQTVNQNVEVYLNCTAEGLPKPNISWSRLSDNRVVTMPLNITGRKDQGGYRCKAYNGIGDPDTADVFITVQSKSNSILVLGCRPLFSLSAPASSFFANGEYSSPAD